MAVGGSEERKKRRTKERKKTRKQTRKGEIEDLKKDLHALTRRVGEFEEREVLYTP